MKYILLLPIALGITIGACSPVSADNLPKDLIDTRVDPNSWALVPAGEFYSGQHDHETMIPYDYEIMVTDVTNAQFAEYLNEALATDWIIHDGSEILGPYPGDPYHGGRHEVEIEEGDWLHVTFTEPGLRLLNEDGSILPVEGYQNHPMVHVTWFGAKAYCEFYGGRLPSELEWEKAARGSDTRPYPWGDKIGPENANYYSSHDAFEKTFGKQGDTTPVGYYNGDDYQGFETIDSTSPYGLYDMAGNVWQWTSDVYEGQHYRYMRGGSKANYAYNLRIWTRNNAGPDYHSPSVGFRCVRDVGGP